MLLTRQKTTQMTLTLALSYGSREELVAAVRNICKVKNIISIDAIDDSIINEHLTRKIYRT
jgi:undecaprenyl diphosphate synthase